MVSIIIPNYNNSDYLYSCLQSIEIQNYDDIEVIVIDDGSTDNSVDIIKRFSSNSKYKYHLIEQFNQNGAVARNRGIEIASGKFLYFLDSDDVLYDECSIKTLVEEMGNCDLLLTNYITIDGNGEKLGEYNNLNYFLNYEDKYKYVNISPVPSNKLFLKKKIVENNIYFSNVRIGQDLNFFLKYLSVCNKIKVSDFYSYKYRIVSNSVTRNVNMNVLDIFFVFEDIRKFYHLNGYDFYFNRYIVNVALKHFHQQFSKVNKLDDKKLVRAMFAFFNFCVNRYSLYAINKDSFYKKQISLFFIKKFLIKCGLYSFFLEKRKKYDL